MPFAPGSGKERVHNRRLGLCLESNGLVDQAQARAHWEWLQVHAMASVHSDCLWLLYSYILQAKISPGVSEQSPQYGAPA